MSGTFCKSIETISHLFFDCEISQKLVAYSLNLKDIVCYYDNPDNSKIEYAINFIIVYGKLIIYKQRFPDRFPNSQFFF